MKKGTKPLMIPLRREDRGIKDDPQFSPYLPGERYIVFHDYGHPDELGEFEARTWINGIVQAIRAVKADRESLRLQNEFYERSTHPLDTPQ